MKSSISLLAVSAVLLVSPLSFAGNKVEHSLKKDIKLTLITAPFVESKHRIRRCGKESVCLIDDLPFFGSDGSLPKIKLVSMVLNLKGKKIPLDVSGMYEPYTNKDRFSIKHSWADVWVLRGSFSDGAGSYQVQWLISYGKSIRTLLMDGESLSAPHLNNVFADVWVLMA